MEKFCCQNLEDFFDDDLNERELQTFHQSLKSCTTCREIIDQQSHVDQLILKSWNSIRIPQLSSAKLIPADENMFSDSRVGLKAAWQQPSVSEINQSESKLARSRSKIQRRRYWIASITTISLLFVVAFASMWSFGILRNEKNTEEFAKKTGFPFANSMSAKSDSDNARDSEGDSEDFAENDRVNSTELVQFEPKNGALVDSTGNQILMPIVSNQEFTLVRVYQTTSTANSLSEENFDEK